MYFDPGWRSLWEMFLWKYVRRLSHDQPTDSRMRKVQEDHQPTCSSCGRPLDLHEVPRHADMRALRKKEE